MRNSYLELLVKENMTLRDEVKRGRQMNKFVIDAYNQLLGAFKLYTELQHKQSDGFNITDNLDFLSIAGTTPNSDEPIFVPAMTSQNSFMKFPVTSDEDKGNLSNNKISLTSMPSNIKHISLVSAHPEVTQNLIDKLHSASYTDNSKTTHFNRLAGPSRKIIKPSSMLQPLSYSPIGNTDFVVQQQMMFHDQRRKNESYFLFFENDSIKTTEGINNARKKSLLHRSEQRCQAINETSKRRAAIAANRRAVAMDLLRGKRSLDNDALKVLHTDSSKISSFPVKYMQQRRIASKFLYEKNSEILKARKEERHCQQEAAINRLLAHCSAAVAKTRL